MELHHKPRVLLVEDDPELGPLIVELLEDDFDVVLARNGQEGLHLGLTGHWDALIIDRGLPLLEGTALVNALRRQGVPSPILILTARSSTRDKVEGLDSGANDYLTKPFDAEELAARLRALTRSYEPTSRILSVGQWSLDPEARYLASPYGDKVDLSPREVALLSLLARNPDRIFSREEILAKVFETAGPGTVDTYVHYLRRKLGKSIIHTAHGAGYRLGEPS